MFNFKRTGLRMVILLSMVLGLCACGNSESVNTTQVANSLGPVARFMTALSLQDRDAALVLFADDAVIKLPNWFNYRPAASNPSDQTFYSPIQIKGWLNEFIGHINEIAVDHTTYQESGEVSAWEARLTTKTSTGTELWVSAWFETITEHNKIISITLTTTVLGEYACTYQVASHLCVVKATVTPA